MDHHCPWINNCVGLTNQKLFILFLLYTTLSSILTLIMLIGGAAGWLWSQKSWSEAAPPSNIALICSGLVAVECLAAVVFVGEFLTEQVESIQMNSTLVETYQRTHGKRSTFFDHFCAVFGNEWWAWPLPFPSSPPPDYTEPAIPDDVAGPASYAGFDGSDDLGIAGQDDEGTAPPRQFAHGSNNLRAEAQEHLRQRAVSSTSISVH